MSIDAIENNQSVKMPDGRLGKVRVTRRERKLIEAGKLTMVDVLRRDGIRERHYLKDLRKVHAGECINCFDYAELNYKGYCEYCED